MRAWVAAQMCRVCLLRHSWRLLGLSKLVGRPGLLQGAWLGLLGGALRGGGSITAVHLQVQELFVADASPSGLSLAPGQVLTAHLQV